MVWPLVAVAGASAIGGLAVSYSQYNAAKRYSDYQDRFYRGAYYENKRFWNDYRRAHHWSANRKVRYPYRTGAAYNLSPLYGADYRKVSARNSVYRSAIGGLTSVGYHSVYRKSPRIVNIYN